mmetsp:Transcript_36177/g.94097  ORF Transcript_36177/g.94097 Transcript_36177/m.94097 type:complete len:401 (-) Transcript_36177:23-1225(-)
MRGKRSRRKADVDSEDSIEDGLVEAVGLLQMKADAIRASITTGSRMKGNGSEHDTSSRKELHERSRRKLKKEGGETQKAKAGRGKSREKGGKPRRSNTRMSLAGERHKNSKTNWKDGRVSKDSISDADLLWLRSALGQWRGAFTSRKEEKNVPIPLDGHHDELVGQVDNGRTVALDKLTSTVVASSHSRSHTSSSSVHDEETFTSSIEEGLKEINHSQVGVAQENAVEESATALSFLPASSHVEGEGDPAFRHLAGEVDVSGDEGGTSLSLSPSPHRPSHGRISRVKEESSEESIVEYSEVGTAVDFLRCTDVCDQEVQHGAAFPTLHSRYTQTRDVADTFPPYQQLPSLSSLHALLRERAVNAIVREKRRFLLLRSFQCWCRFTVETVMFRTAFELALK